MCRAAETIAGKFFDYHVVYFRPTNPDRIHEGWFLRTKDWYDKKEKGLIPGKPISFHYWAVDGERFIGEFQLRTDFTKQVLTGIGNMGYAVRVSNWGKGYGSELLDRLYAEYITNPRYSNMYAPSIAARQFY